MMLSKRTAIWLLAWASLVMAAPPVLAQFPGNAGADFPGPSNTYSEGGAPFATSDASKTHSLWPVAPGHIGSYSQPFAPARTSTYGNGPRPHQGWFFGYQRLVWSLSQPESSFLGAPPIDTFPAFGTNFFFPSAMQTIDNSFIKGVPGWGNRWEIGYMDDTDYGFLVSILDHVSQGQYDTKPNAFITFGDPLGLLIGYITAPIPDTDPTQFITVEIGQMPGFFEELHMRNKTTLNGVEAMRTYRAPRLHKGGYFEVMYGVRWFQMVDGNEVWGRGYGSGVFAEQIFNTVGTFPANMLDQSYWATVVQNNLVGPQIGLRWFAQRGHWHTSVEGRFLAAANFQNVHQKTFLGTETPQNVAAILNGPANIAFVGLSTNRHGYNTTFSPMGELRVAVSYIVSRNINLKVGYDGMVVGNLSRASNRVDYNHPNLIGITPKSNNELFFVNGLSFGVEINR